MARLLLLLLLFFPIGCATPHHFIAQLSRTVVCTGNPDQIQALVASDLQQDLHLEALKEESSEALGADEFSVRLKSSADTPLFVPAPREWSLTLTRHSYMVVGLSTRELIQQVRDQVWILRIRKFGLGGAHYHAELRVGLAPIPQQKNRFLLQTELRGGFAPRSSHLAGTYHDEFLRRALTQVEDVLLRAAGRLGVAVSIWKGTGE